MARRRSGNRSFGSEDVKGGRFSEEELRNIASLHVPISSNEYERVQALRESKALTIDDMDERFARLVNLAVKVFKIPIVALNMIEVETIWVKARVNVPMSTFSRDYSFCSHLMLDSSPSSLVVNDAQLVDGFSKYPFVAGPPYIRFYAGAPLYSGGYRIGTLCIVDMQPHYDFDAKKQQSLIDLANSASDLIELLKGSDKRMHSESHHLKMTLMRHISTPLFAVDEHHRQLHHIIHLCTKISNPSFNCPMEQLELLLKGFSSKVEQLSSTLEIALRLGTNFVRRQDESVPFFFTNDMLSVAGVPLQSYAHRLEQLTSLVGCTGRSLQFTVDPHLHQDKFDDISQWEIVPRSAVLDVLATVISYLSLEFISADEVHTHRKEKTNIHLSCLCLHPMEGDKLLHHGELLIELSFPITSPDPIVTNSPTTTDPTATTIYCHHHCPSFCFMEEILSYVQSSIQFPPSSSSSSSLDLHKYHNSQASNIVKIVVPCQISHNHLL